MAAEKSQNYLQIGQIAKVNLRYNFLPLLLLSVGMMVITPILFGTSNLDPIAAAAPLELLISTIGMILLIPVFEPEQSREIQDIVAVKYVDCIYVYIIRISYSVIGLLLLILLFSGYMRGCGCEISFPLVFGTFADAIFLGATGLLASAVTGSLPVAFMVSLLYYGFSYTMGSRLGVFNLFSMMRGDYAPNIWLFLVGIGLLAVAAGIKRGKSGSCKLASFVLSFL